MNLHWPLRLGGRAKREEQNAKSEREDFVSPESSNQKSKIENPKLFHLITLSARYSTDCGIVTPICFAVFKLMTNSYSLGCSTGSSCGRVPVNTFLTYLAEMRPTS